MSNYFKKSTVSKIATYLESKGQGEIAKSLRGNKNFDNELLTKKINGHKGGSSLKVSDWDAIFAILNKDSE